MNSDRKKEQGKRRQEQEEQKAFGIDWDAVEQKLFDFPRAISSQPQIVRSLRELKRLRELVSLGRTSQVGFFLKKRADEAVNYWKRRLGVDRGRPPKPLLAQADARCARSVHSYRRRFRDAFDLKRQLRTRKTPKEEIIRRLNEAGYPGEIVAESSTPAAAAYRYVAKDQGMGLDTVKRYYERYRPLLKRLEYLSRLPPKDLERLLSGKNADF